MIGRVRSAKTGMSDLKPNVEKMKERKDIKGLIKAVLGHKCWDVRSEAMRALREIGDSRAVEPLIQALEDENPFVRFNAVEALMMIRAEKAVEPLIETLKDEDWNVRKEAASALGEIGVGTPINSLIQAVKDMNYEKIRNIFPDHEVVALFVFNSDEICDTLNIGFYGGYVQKEFLKALLKVVKWSRESTLPGFYPSFYASHGDLFGDALEALYNWLVVVGSKYRINAAFANSNFINKMKATQKLGYVAYALCIGPIPEWCVVATDKDLRHAGVTGYLGALILRGHYHPKHVSQALGLVLDKEIYGDGCRGWADTDEINEIIREAGLKKRARETVLIGAVKEPWKEM